MSNSTFLQNITDRLQYDQLARGVLGECHLYGFPSNRAYNTGCSDSLLIIMAWILSCKGICVFNSFRERYIQFVNCTTAEDVPLTIYVVLIALQWRHNERNGISNHQPSDRLLDRRRLKKTPKLRVTGFCAGNSPVTGEFPAQRASYAENVSIWWRHHGMLKIRTWVTRLSS